MEALRVALPPEARLLLLAAGGAENDAAIAQLVAGGLDWPLLGWLADRERATPVLWRRLRDVSPESLPPAADDLRRQALVAEFKMAMMEERLGLLLRGLRAGGIEVILLKGAALAVSLYGSFARRPMGDLDLLVPAGSAASGYAIAQAGGWQVGPEGPLDAVFAEHHHLQPLDDTTGVGIALELHTELFDRSGPFRFGADDVRRAAIDATAGGEPTRVPHPNHLLLHLCLHFAWSHYMTEGSWRAFRDVGALLGSGRVDQEAFVALARESRGASGCYWTLRLARRLAGVAVSDDLLRALQPPRSAWALERAERHFTQAVLPVGAGCPSLRLARATWRWAMPDACTPGAANPWRRQVVFRGEGYRPPSVRRRAVEQLRRWRVWQQYLQRVMGDGARPM